MQISFATGKMGRLRFVSRLGDVAECQASKLRLIPCAGVNRCASVSQCSPAGSGSCELIPGALQRLRWGGCSRDKQPATKRASNKAATSNLRLKHRVANARLFPLGDALAIIQIRGTPGGR